ncbi:hypothetical protein MMC24_003146 [Lignoscripta atroalba]|nr:hypothetical protein [Lignoscripta atroalba]
MADNPPPRPPPPPSALTSTEPLYGGYTRFELELEFVQSLSSPLYLNHLASSSQKLLQHPPFIAYLRYLLYFTRPEYVKYLRYPGPTLKALELLQEEGFRREILSPETVRRLVEGMMEGTAGQGRR